MHKFKDLKVWQRSIELTIRIYSVTEKYPKHEQFGLTLQTRKSAYSMPMNISEGCGRRSDKEFVRFLDIALGSGFELETQLIIANRLKYISNIEFSELNNETQEIQKMLSGLMKKYTVI